MIAVGSAGWHRRSSSSSSNRFPPAAVDFEFSRPKPLEEIEWTIVNHTRSLKQYVHSVGDESDHRNNNDGAVLLTYEVFVCKECFLRGGGAEAHAGAPRQYCCGKLFIAPAGALAGAHTAPHLTKITFASGCAADYGKNMEQAQ